MRRADLPIIDYDLGFTKSADGKQSHRFTVDARFAESNDLMSRYGFVIIDVIYEGKFPVWRYTEPVRGRAKFGLNKRGSERAQEVLLTILDQFIVDFKYWEQDNRGLQWLGGKIYRSRDDSIRTYKNGGEGLIRHGTVHRAIVEDSLYYHEGEWIPIEDVPKQVAVEQTIIEEQTTIDKTEEQIQVVHKNYYEPQTTNWSQSSITDYYSTNKTQPIESKYKMVGPREEAIAIIAEEGYYSVLTTTSSTPNWIPGSLKGTFQSYQVLKPFDITWITDLGETIDTSAKIDNSGVLTIELSDGKREVYRMVK